MRRACFESLRAAVVAGKFVQMHVTDGKKHGDYCHASRIKIQDEPHVDEDTDGDGVFDLEDDVPREASETVDEDTDGVGDNADPGFRNSPECRRRGRQKAAHSCGRSSRALPQASWSGFRTLATT